MKTLPLSAWIRVKHARRKRKFVRNLQTLSIGVLAFALGGLFGPSIPMVRMEAAYNITRLKNLASQGDALRSYFSTISKWSVKSTQNPTSSSEAGLLVASERTNNPLEQSDGTIIAPVDDQFSLIIPKIGVNAKVIAGVNPASPIEYNKALSSGIAHSSTSYFPDEDGTVYLFSHSTNYDWFVKDLNAVFYLLKNVNEGDKVIIMYKSIPYTYIITGKRVVSPSAVSYLVPQAGVKRLILQTCWPPGSINERLLIFADLTPHDIIKK